jgi:hypothetical protein
MAILNVDPTYFPKRLLGQPPWSALTGGDLSNGDPSGSPFYVYTVAVTPSRAHLPQVRNPD